MKDSLITLFFICFLIILMPKKKRDNKTRKRKKKRSKRKIKRIENFTTIQQKNIYDEPLQLCSIDPMTGWKRDGKCSTHEDDSGTHTVCARVNDEFLDYTKSKGNDLSTPNEYFPGLKDGDNWCLCALRWKQALKSGKAPPIDLKATNKKTLEYIDLDTLEKYKI